MHRLKTVGANDLPAGTDAACRKAMAARCETGQDFAWSYVSGPRGIVSRTVRASVSRSAARFVSQSRQAVELSLPAVLAASGA